MFCSGLEFGSRFGTYKVYRVWALRVQDFRLRFTVVRQGFPYSGHARRVVRTSLNEYEIINISSIYVIHLNNAPFFATLEVQRLSAFWGCGRLLASAPLRSGACRLGVIRIHAEALGDWHAFRNDNKGALNGGISPGVAS